MTAMTPHSSRKSQRVYRSPSDPNEPSPFSKAIKSEEKIMEIDAEDAEAGTILMALKNHTFNINESSSSTYDEKPVRSNSMSISNLLDSESDASMIPPHITPYHSLSSESRPLFHQNEARRNSVKKGFQICITPRRNSSMTIDDDEPPQHQYHPHMRRTSMESHNKNKPRSFRPASTVRIPIHSKNSTKSSMKYKRNTIHIHISYRIHAHRAALNTTPRPIFDRYETSPYPSAFRAPPPSTANNNNNNHDWNNNSNLSSHHPTFHYQQDNTV